MDLRNRNFSWNDSWGRLSATFCLTECIKQINGRCTQSDDNQTLEQAATAVSPPQTHGQTQAEHSGSGTRPADLAVAHHDAAVTYVVHHAVLVRVQAAHWTARQS